MSGYSGKPLVEKLGYTQQDKILIEGAPKSFVVELQFAELHFVDKPPADWAHVFVSEETGLRAWALRNQDIEISKGLWISWPKKASGLATDVTEQTLRDVLLPLGWVDIKVCAIDDIWSALKFVRRRILTDET